MIIEMRTDTLQPGTVATFEERFGQALPARAKVSPLAAFWHTEVGPLNRVIHVWPYEDMAARTRLREEATKQPGWPPNTREFVVEQQSDIYLPAPFSPALQPRQLGGLYEIRIYTFKPGGIPGVIDRWSDPYRSPATSCRRSSEPALRTRRAQQMVPHLGLQGRERSLPHSEEPAPKASGRPHRVAGRT